jgi:hypothetical protein
MEPPGPIPNWTLLNADGTPKEGLRRGVDFRGKRQRKQQFIILKPRNRFKEK